MVHPHLVGVYGLLAADVGVGGELVYDDLVPGLQLTALYLCPAPPRPSLTSAKPGFLPLNALYSSLLTCTVQCSTVQYNIFKYSTAQYSKIPYSTV